MKNNEIVGSYEPPVTKVFNVAIQNSFLQSSLVTGDTEEPTPGGYDND